MTAHLLIVQAVLTGDYFRLWPDGRACEIGSEDDLREARDMAKLEPNRIDSAKFLSSAEGDLFWILQATTCDECGGEGEVEKFDRWHEADEGMVMGRHAAPRSEECRWCNGVGTYYATIGGTPKTPRTALPWTPEATVFALTKPAPLPIIPRELSEVA